MFSFLKNSPEKKLKKAYLAKLEEAMKAQRNGDIEKYSFLTSEAEAMLQQINQLSAK